MSAIALSVAQSKKKKKKKTEQRLLSKKTCRVNKGSCGLVVRALRLGQRGSELN